MPFGILNYVFTKYRFDDWDTIKGIIWPYGIAIAVIYGIRRWSAGGTNQSLRNLASKVILITGGTSGIGAKVAEQLAEQGAQVLLLVRDHTDPWTIEFIEQLRDRTENPLIYAETCDLDSLLSIREFATKWINTTPPRRLDMVICNAGVLAPPFSQPRETSDGIEWHWGINYLGHYHLLNLLSPAIRVQPLDRDVRIIFTTCALYAVGKLDDAISEVSPWKAFGASKLALMMTAQDLQTQFKKSDRGGVTNIRVYCVDPGLVRTPLLRGFLSMGSVWGLLLYLIMWPIWYLILKSPWEGAQTVLHCAMTPVDYNKRAEDGWTSAGYYRDCKEAVYQREEIASVQARETLKKRTEKEISDAEKKTAIRRKVDKAKSKQKSK